MDPLDVLLAQDDAAFPTDFLAPLEGFVDGSAADSALSPCMSEDLDQLFEQPNRSNASAMRQAFSMNDLQSLALETAQPVWHQRHVSVKPTLESVPEGGPPPATQSMQPAHMGLGHSGMLSSSAMYHPTADFQAAAFQQQGMAYGAASLPGTSGQDAAAGHHQPYMMAGFHHHDENAYGAGLVQGRPAGEVPLMFPMPYPCGAMPVGLMPPGGPAVKMMQGPSSMKPEMMATAAGFIQASPEHHMADAVKQDPAACDTDSSGNGHQQPLRPTAAVLRKSHSALELGAWRKMATGDLDCVDPSGSVRETLHGLELAQVGKLTPEERLQKILRYRAKRQMRNFNRTIKYQCRKSLADTRPRVRGRFARDNEPGSVLPHETKKAQREKAGKGAGKGGSPPLSAVDEVDQKQQQKQQQHDIKEEPMSSLAAAAQAAPMPAAQAPGGYYAAAPAAAASTPPTEHHATALAHLYNQWSEVTVAPPGGGGKLG